MCCIYCIEDHLTQELPTVAHKPKLATLKAFQHRVISRHAGLVKFCIMVCSPVCSGEHGAQSTSTAATRGRSGVLRSAF